MFTIVSFILAALLLFKLKKNKSDYFILTLKTLIVFSLYINIGYFMKIGSFELLYSEILTVLVVLLGTFRVKFSMPKKSIFSVLTLFIVILIGYAVLLNFKNPPMVLPVGGSWDGYFIGREYLLQARFGSSHYLRLIRIVLFICLLYVFDRTLDKKMMLNIKKFVVNSAIFFAGFGLIEQIIKISGSNIISELTTRFFGEVGSHLTWIAVRGGLPVLQGLTLEPGHYAQSFIPAILILFLDENFTEKKRFFCFILFSYVIFFSGSFAGVAIVFFMAMLYLFSNKDFFLPKLFFYFLSMILALVVIGKTQPLMFQYYTLRITSFFRGNSIGTSEGVRMTSLESAINLFKAHPYFGVGLGTTDVSGFIPTLLANVGIVGSAFWFVLMINGFKKAKLQNVFWLVTLMLLFFFIGGMKNLYGLDMILIFSLVFRRSLPDDELKPENEYLSAITVANK